MKGVCISHQSAWGYYRQPIELLLIKVNHVSENSMQETICFMNCHYALFCLLIWSGFMKYQHWKNYDHCLQQHKAMPWCDDVLIKLVLVIKLVRKVIQKQHQSAVYWYLLLQTVFLETVLWSSNRQSQCNPYQGILKIIANLIALVLVKNLWRQHYL